MSLANVVRWTYFPRARQAFGHVVEAVLPDGASDEEIIACAAAILGNPALSGLVKGQDYRWAGALGVAFRSKDRAAMFLLFAPR